MGSGRQDSGALSLGIMAMMFLAASVDGREFRVGDKNGWTQPNPANATTPSETYNQWAERHRFQIGDTLLFVYDKNEDSVLQVSAEDYETCSGSNPVASYDNGRTVVKLTTSGPHYFISGVKEHCQNSEKLVVVVLALRGGGQSPGGPVENPAVGPEGRPANVAVAPRRSEVVSVGFVGAAFCVLNLLNLAGYCV